MSDGLKQLLGVLVVAILIPIVPFAVVGELPGEQWLEASSTNALRFGLTGALLLCGDVLLPIPSSIIGSLLGARLGFFAGFGWTFLGLSLGNLIGYVVGRLTPARWTSDLPDVPASAAVFLSRTVPVLAEAVTFAAGAARMPLSRFLASSAAGNAVYALVMAGNGATFLPDSLLGPGLVVPMLVPVLAWLGWQRLRPNL